MSQLKTSRDIENIIQNLDRFPKGEAMVKVLKKDLGWIRIILRTQERRVKFELESRDGTEWLMLKKVN